MNSTLLGGPAGHAGNLFHYLYAATRVMELLDSDQHVHSVRLEGLLGVSDEQILDVVVEGDDGVELIQVKWSATSKKLTPDDFWQIAKRLWANSKQVGSRGYRTRMLICTNRQLSQKLKVQWELLQSWKNLSQEQIDLLAKKNINDQIIAQVKKELNGCLGGNTRDTITFIQSIDINHSLGSGAIDDKRRTLDLQLKALSLVPEKHNTGILNMVINHCLPINARKAITAQTLQQLLGLSTGPRLRHDIELPVGYTEWNALENELNNNISGLATNGGIVVVVGSPGSGKSVQLNTWAKKKQYPFYACRLGDQYDDIPNRANQAKFMVEISHLIRQGYKDRISGAYNGAEETNSGTIRNQTHDSLIRLLNALGAASKPSDPGVLVIDGLDDAYRWDAVNSFLCLLQLPPPGVVLVVSAQGCEFLPEWMRNPGVRIKHIPVTQFPDELSRKVIFKLLSSGLDMSNKPPTGEMSSLVEKIVRISAGNLLVLRTICIHLYQEDRSRWQSILDSAGDEPFRGIDSYFSKVLGSPSGDELRCLKSLAIARIPLTADQIGQVTQCQIEDLQSAITRLRFILKYHGDSPRRYSLYHISLRRYIEKNWFEADQSKYHDALSSLFMKQPRDLNAATEIPYHLLKAERLEDVVRYITFEHIDRLFNEFITPSRIEEQMTFLASAASRLGRLGEAFRAALLATKVDQRLNFLTPPSRDNIDGSTTEFEIVLKVLAPCSDELIRSKAIDLLREVQNPERRYDIAVKLALGAFRSGNIDFAKSALQVARDVMLFYHAPRSPETAKNEAACSVWSGKKLIDIYAELKSAEWVQHEHNSQEQKPLPLSEQYKLRGDTLRSMSFEAVKANKEVELHELVDKVARVYKTYLLLGMCEAKEIFSSMDIKKLVEEADKARYLTPQERIKIASLFLKTSTDYKEATKISHLRNRKLNVVDTQGASLPEYVSKFNSFLNELCMRVRLGVDIELSYDDIMEGDSQKAAQYFYNAAISLFIAEAMKKDNKSKSVVVEKIEAACKAWEFERPYSMWWTPFFDARRQLWLITYRLIRLAFDVDEETGSHIGQRIWNLKGWAIGALDLDTKLDILKKLGDIHTARSWIVKELDSCVEEVKSSVRDTSQRVSLFLKSADAYNSLGMLEKARELVSCAVTCTKGLPEVDEEPRYLACLILLEALYNRGQDVLPLLKRLGRCIDESYEATGSRYAGYSWPWLVEVSTKVNLVYGLSLAAELDDESIKDEYLPDIQTSLRRIIIQEDLNITPEQWMALFWIVGGVPDDRPPHKDKDIEDIINGVLAACKSESIRQRIKIWIDSLRNGNGKKGDSESTSYKGGPNSLILASKTAIVERLWQEAINGSEGAIHTIIEHLSGWLPQKMADHSLDFDFTKMIEDFLVDSVPYCFHSDISKIRELYRLCWGISYEAPLLMKMARREMTQNPQKAKELLLDAIDGSYWDGSALLAEEFRILTDIDNNVSRHQIVERIAWRNKTFSPFYVARTLIELPDSLVSYEDLYQISNILCSDIEDSLSILPPRPVRVAFTDSYSPPISNVPELVRHLLHNRNKEVRQGSLEAVGILAIEGVGSLVSVFCSQDGIDRLPTYLQLTAEQQRLAALWVLAEIDAKPLRDFVDNIYSRYVKDNAPRNEHFLMFEYGRQICSRILEMENTSGRIVTVPKYDIPSRQPMKLERFTDNFSPGSDFLFPLGVIDKGLEHDFELLSQMFRIRARVLERFVRKIKNRVGSLSEEEIQLDRWIIDQQYTNRSSRPIITAREELVRHAYRIVQQWCFLNRAADADLLEKEGIAYFERRELDPWLPRLFTSVVSIPFGPPQPNEDGEEGDKWFQADLPDLTHYIDIGNNIVLHEFVTEGKTTWQAVCSIESCFISENLEKQWLEEKNLEGIVHYDFPMYIYIREVTQDFNWWWGHWTYGDTKDEAKCRAAAYVVEGLAITEHYYAVVSRPSPLLASDIKLGRTTFGYVIWDNFTNSVIWENHNIDSSKVRVLAARGWMLSKLKELGLLLAFEIRVTKEKRRKESWGYGLEKNRYLTLKCVMDHQGIIRWGCTKDETQEYSRTRT